MKCALIDKTTSASNAKEVCSKKFCINNCVHGQYRNGKVTCLLGSTDKFEGKEKGNGTRTKKYIQKGAYIKRYKKESKGKMRDNSGETTNRGKRLSRMNKTRAQCTTNTRRNDNEGS